MNRRDSVVALILLLFVAVMAAESFEIRKTTFSSLPAETWPQILLVALGILCATYLLSSVRGRTAPAELDEIEADAAPGWRATISRYANPALCFLAFFAFLLLMPLLGILLGGMLFVFVCLCLIGQRGMRAMAVHAAIAIVSVASMWAVFSFGLGVFLPPGELISLR